MQTQTDVGLTWRKRDTRPVDHPLMQQLKGVFVEWQTHLTEETSSRTRSCRPSRTWPTTAARQSAANTEIRKT